MLGVINCRDYRELVLVHVLIIAHVVCVDCRHSLLS